MANIIKDLSLYTSGEDGESQHPILTSLNALQSALAQPNKSCISHLTKICDECNIDLAHRLLAGKNEAYPILVSLCKSFKDNSEGLSAALDALCSLCNGQPDLLNEDGAKLFCGYITTYNNAPELLVKVVTLIKYTCLMHETNRQLYVSLDIIPSLVALLDNHKNQASVVKETCILLRVLTLDDDVRVPFGKGHEHAKMIVTEEGALKKILNICEGIMFFALMILKCIPLIITKVCVQFWLSLHTSSAFQITKKIRLY